MICKPGNMIDSKHALNAPMRKPTNESARNLERDRIPASKVGRATLLDRKCEKLTWSPFSLRLSSLRRLYRLWHREPFSRPWRPPWCQWISPCRRSSSHRPSFLRLPRRLWYREPFSRPWFHPSSLLSPHPPQRP